MYITFNFAPFFKILNPPFPSLMTLQRKLDKRNMKTHFYFTGCKLSKSYNIR